jgi:hypothetical protein
MEFLGDSGAAQRGSPLEHANGKTATREIRGASEPVMAATDDDGVVAASGAAHERLRKAIVMCGVARARGTAGRRLQSSLSPAATIENPLST